MTWEEYAAAWSKLHGGVDPVTGAILTASVGHDWYLEPGTESLRNLSLIGIDRGDYGACERCGEPIGFSRLQARPEAALCIACQTLLERRR